MENYNFLFETFFYQLNHKEENSKERPTCNFCIQTCVQQLQEKRETELQNHISNKHNQVLPSYHFSIMNNRKL